MKTATSRFTVAGRQHEQRTETGALRSAPAGSPHAKAALDVPFHLDRPAVLFPGLEPPLVNRLDCLGIQSRIEALLNTQIVRSPVGTHLHSHDGLPLNLRLAGLLGVVGLDFNNEPRAVTPSSRTL